MSSFPVSIFQGLAGIQTFAATGFAATFYVIAMIAMKYWTTSPTLLTMVVVICALLIGTMFEIAALSGERLGMIYVTILATEVILIAAAAVLIFGESFTTRELAGCCLVLLGTALAWS